jgi:hypothetical protein
LLGRLLVLVLLGLALVWALHWFRRTPPEKVARVLRKAALWGGIGVVVLLALTGRLSPIFAALAAAVPLVLRLVNLVRMLPVIQQVMRTLGLGSIPLGGATGAGGKGKTSSIRTRFLEMTLDHASGDMDGLVLEGPYEGRLLSSLQLGQLLELQQRYRSQDAQSAALLEAYLDRSRGEAWREETAASGGPPASDAPMNREEALAILGLDAGADRDAVREAHRRLMQRLHPDRGGSDYLAAKINEAKRVLLGE